MEMTTRYPNYAGSFYPESRTNIIEMFYSFISEISIEDKEQKYKNALAIIVPHAGYVYSGKCAMHAYNVIKDYDFDTAIIIGRSHKYRFDYAAVDSHSIIKTPIGNINRDEDIYKYLLETYSIFTESKKEHDVEHSIEVQMPFISYCNENYNKNISVVSILLGNDIIDISSEIVATINNFNNKAILIVCSTDLSHFYNYEHAKSLDDNFKNLLVNFDVNGLAKASVSKENNIRAEACAMVSVINTINIAKKIGKKNIYILNQCSSYDSDLPASKDKNRVVGYMSAIIY